MYFSSLALTCTNKKQLFGFMKNFSPQVPLVGLLEMPEVHEEVKVLLPVVHKQAQEHLSQSQLLLFVLVLAAG